jgi:hypothetical protein
MSHFFPGSLQTYISFVLPGALIAKLSFFPRPASRIRNHSQETPASKSTLPHDTSQRDKQGAATCYFDLGFPGLIQKQIPLWVGVFLRVE